MAKKLRIDGQSSTKFKSFAKGRSLEDILSHFSKSSTYSNAKEIDNIIEDLISLRADNAEILSKAEMENILSLTDDLSRSKDIKLTKKPEVVKISMNEMKKLSEKANIGTESPSPAQSIPKVVAKSTPKKQKATPKKSPKSKPPKPSSTPKQEVVMIKVVDTNQSSADAPVASPASSLIRETKKSEKNAVKALLSDSTAGVSKSRRSGEQIQAEKMKRLHVQEMHELNKKEELIEIKRHRLEMETIEKSKLLLREKEIIVKETEELNKAQRLKTTAALKRGSLKFQTEKMHRNMDFLESETGQTFHKDRNRTVRNVESARTKRARLAKEKAEISLLNTQARNMMKEKQMLDRQARDRDRRARQAMEKRSRTNDKIRDILHQSSPLLAMSYSAGGSLFNMMNRPSPSTQPTPNQTPAGSSGGFLQGVLGGAVGSGGFLAGKSILGSVSGSISRGVSNAGNALKSAKNSIGTKFNSPSYYKAPSTMGKIAKTALRSGGLPLIGGAISGAMEYNNSGSASKAVAVGTGTMIGAGIGAAAMSFLGPPGMLFGGIVGGALGEKGAKALADKFLGKAEADMKAPVKKKNIINDYVSPYANAKPVRSAGRGASSSASPSGNLEQDTINELNRIGITDPRAQANILAQLKAESGFNLKEENLNYSPKRLMEVFPKYFKNLDDAKAVVAGGKEAIGNRIYGGRMNNASNEGYKYRGRGLVQLTGKDNYKRIGDMIGVDLVNNPDLANDPRYAARIAASYYKMRGNGKDLSDINQVNKLTGFADKGSSSIRADYANEYYSSLSSAQSALDNKKKVRSSSPTQVVVANQGATSSNVNNTTIINKPDTDPTLALLARQSMYGARILSL